MLRSRLAPTPSGFLHLGNVFSFILTWLVVRKADGHLHLRIDDLDAERAKPAYYDDIFSTLDWLGLDYDSGPRTQQDCLYHWSQRHRRASYNQALERLVQQGAVFACECSRSLLAEQAPSGIYPGNCRNKNLPLTLPNLAWRINLSEDSFIAFRDARLGECRIDTASAQGDVIIRRRDGIPAYHIASLADDLAQQITFIVRGEDLLPSTAVQLAIAERLGEHSFCRVHFLHHHLVREDSGKKLSKSHDSLSLKALREQGITREEVYERCADFLGISPATPSLQGLLEAFSLESFAKQKR